MRGCALLCAESAPFYIRDLRIYWAWGILESSRDTEGGLCMSWCVFFQLWKNIHSKIFHFYVCRPVSLSTFTLFCSCHHIPSKLFPHLKLKLVPIGIPFVAWFFIFYKVRSPHKGTWKYKFFGCKIFWNPQFFYTGIFCELFWGSLILLEFIFMLWKAFLTLQRVFIWFLFAHLF